ncbi:AAA family ATPase [Burkholderia sp. BCC1047]|uniref:ATP-binding sensor histidine kinase n=1 Tax=Burkholderia sp. BCC1047 TaxID=2676299 RepID=UPI00158BD3B4|nr:AAA family ATPase [Burkholderia sp. BCC1047]
MGERLQVLWDDGERIVSRGTRQGGDGDGSVLYAYPSAERPLPSSVERLTHEFGLKDHLDGAWAVRPLKLLRADNRTMLMLEDPGGEPLTRLIGAPMETGVFLRIAVAISEALVKLHKHGLHHKDLKPPHILVNCADGRARLTGFGLASRVPRERLAPEPPETIAGSLAYMAPEQTGRMNRSVDSRSDLYALGVTFYQMLTGTLPFSATDAMEWVHCHIARRPVPPSGRVSVPATLSHIIMKLLAKTAEDRYQTAAGLAHDLQRCMADWDRQRWVDDFRLDEHGTLDRLLIPERLYGREREVDTMCAAFERVVNTSFPELMLVSGYSGIGKSSVVNELHRVLVPPRGLFASGKFDQYKRHIPYSTLVQAFQSLVRTLLCKSDGDLAKWRGALRDALEPNAALMTDLIPELKLIIGEPPPLPMLEPQQAQQRFLLVFRRFLGVFAKAEHPLVLFLDDLQWLDTATLDLIEDLLVDSDLRYLMLIGAYRDNEVDATHPLTVRLQAIRRAGVKIGEIKLAPLSKEHIEQLIAESLHCEPGCIEPLARLVGEKTEGNPFFLIQFLQTLADEELLTFDHDALAWTWDTARIHEKGYTDNIVDLMVGKLIRLPVETQLALQQLACVGNIAETSTLASVFGVPESAVPEALWEAVRQELVVRPEGSYAFVHDRVHEAAYSTIPEDARAEAHLRIGRVLAVQTPLEQLEEAIFEIVGQLNRGAALITERDEREQLAEFNLLAGRRAKASTAYASALTYLTTGLALLNDDCWARRHELIFALELSLAECEFLTGQQSAAEARLAALFRRANTTVERAQVACWQMDLHLILDQSDDAVAVCLAFLRGVGLEWSPHQDEVTVRSEYKRIWSLLGDRTIDELIDLPPMRDEVALTIVEALAKLIPPALCTDQNLACLAICKAITLSLEYGNGNASCVAYANFPRVAGRFFGDAPARFKFSQLGCELVERRSLERYKPSTYLCFSIFAARWAEPVRTCGDQLRRVFDMANRIGDLLYGAFSRNSLVSNLLFIGEPLLELQREAESGLVYARKVRFGLVINFIENQLALIRMLRGLTPKFGCFDDGQFNEAQVEQQLANPSLALAACLYWIRKLQACCIAGDYLAATHAASRAKTLLWTSHLFIEEGEYHFYGALALSGLCDSGPGSLEAGQLEAMTVHYRQLQVWTEQCPSNFAGHTALVGAEIARLEGRAIDAEMLYEQAIDLAQESGFVHIEALANEFASRFYVARGLGKIARMYMQDARYGYQRWGADGKVRQLEENNPSLSSCRGSDSSKLGPTATIETPVEHLDLATVIKVSQAASGDIVLERLIDMVMRTAIEQAGAARGLLILSVKGEHSIVAEATTSESGIQLKPRDVPVSGEMLPEAVLYHVLRTRESIILDEAAVAPAFINDPYISEHRARSILCLPLMNQAKLTGALYLENNLTARAFSPARIAVLKLVASQAAISLENARLYRDVEEREAKIRRLVDANIIGILVWNSNGEILEANDVFLRIVGYDRNDLATGKLRWRDLTPMEAHQDADQILRELRQTGRVEPFEKEYFRKDGSRVPVIVGLATFEARRNEGVAFVLDLTEQKQAEEKIRESERRYREVQTEMAHANRVATMGQLAASIAHEVNQPIAATVTNAQAAQRWLNLQPPDINEAGLALSRIVKDTNRASDVLGRIRQLIRKAPPRKEPVNVNEAIREVIELTRGEARKSGASVEIHLTDGLPCVEGDRVELQQVLLNLVVNALEAMNCVGDGERKLHISTRISETGSVLVTVRDSGPGFGQDKTKSVFAPFYTTKPTGLGMGLSICRSIIDAHGGELWASDNSPRGAVVQFTIPLHPITTT